MLCADIINILVTHAKKSDMRDKHAAILMNKGRVIGAGHNQPHNSIKRYIKKEKSLPLSRHAEEDVFRSVNHRDLRGATLYVIRWSADKNFMNSRPCKRCSASIQKMMRKNGLRRIFYSITSDDTGYPVWNEFC